MRRATGLSPAGGTETGAVAGVDAGNFFAGDALAAGLVAGLDDAVGGGLLVELALDEVVDLVQRAPGRAAPTPVAVFHALHLGLGCGLLALADGDGPDGGGEGEYGEELHLDGRGGGETCGKGEGCWW